jgi:hypothetical protein
MRFDYLNLLTELTDYAFLKNVENQCLEFFNKH